MVLGLNWKSKAFAIDGFEVNVDRIDHTEKEWCAPNLQCRGWGGGA